MCVICILLHMVTMGRLKLWACEQTGRKDARTVRATVIPESGRRCGLEGRATSVEGMNPLRKSFFEMRGRQ